MTLAETSVVTPALKDELLEDALVGLDTVLDMEPLVLLEDAVDKPAEEVLGRSACRLDVEALIDIDMPLLVDVVLPEGVEVNGWLVADVVDSG